MSGQQFDVFLAHNSKDKPMIREIYRSLKERGINPWLDEEAIPPGQLFQKEIQEAIGFVKTAAIFIGSDGLGRWQAFELKILISQCVERNIRVIPVLLPGVEEIPDGLLLLREFHAVSFRHSISDEDGLFRLEWGITGQKPQPPSKYDLPSNTNPPQQQQPLRPTQSTSPPQTEQDDLSSERFGAGYYIKLNELLAAKEWKKANDETVERMCEVMGHPKHWLLVRDIKKFPCSDLQRIDNLWMKYSDGQFGFSVQEKIWESYKSKKKTTHQVAWEMFCEDVGWRRKPLVFRLLTTGDKDLYIQDKDMTFSAIAPKGHLPFLTVVGALAYRPSHQKPQYVGGFYYWGWAFYDRLKNCAQ